jgi:hypothetical protein
MSEDGGPVPIWPFIQKLDAASEQVAPADRAELVRLVVLLFTAVRATQHAYVRDRDRNTAETYESFRASVNTLRSAIDSLGATLHIFAPSVFASVTKYYTAEREKASEFSDEDLESLNELKYSLYDSFRVGYNDPSVRQEDFDVVIDQLGKFIRENFSMEEVFRASST